MTKTFWYVAFHRPGSKLAIVVSQPYDTKQEAEKHVEEIHRKIYEANRPEYLRTLYGKPYGVMELENRIEIPAQKLGVLIRFE